jgi:hypothetical protein
MLGRGRLSMDSADAREQKAVTYEKKKFED